MALSRSRIVCANTDEFTSTLTDLRHQALSSRRPDLNMPKDIADMLGRVRKEKPAKHDWDLKNRFGAMRDIEFSAQKLYLLNRDRVDVKTAYTTAKMLELNSPDLSRSDAESLKSLEQGSDPAAQHMQGPLVARAAARPVEVRAAVKAYRNSEHLQCLEQGVKFHRQLRYPAPLLPS